MKKLVFMFVAMAAISFASCGNTEKAGDAADSLAADSAATVADSAAAVADSAAAVADSAAAVADSAATAE